MKDGLSRSCWIATLIAVGTFTSVPTAEGDWPQFRGPQANGNGGDASPPVEWSLESGENVAWAADLPGRGPASPIVVGDRVIVTCSSGAQQDRLHIIAFDTETGRKVWHRQFWATGRTMCHPTSANAAPTPASDGRLIAALYSSCDLACVDVEGNLQWYRGLALDYPKAGNDVGMSSSPVFVGDTVVAQVEAQGDSFVEGLDKHTGKTLWHMSRPTESNWCSPTAWLDPAAGEERLLLQSRGEIAAIDPASGATLWTHAAGFSSIASASPIGSVLLAPANGVTAFQLPSGSGQPEVLWRENRLATATASPVIHQGHVYVVNRAGVLKSGDLATGKIEWEKRLGGAYWATPVAVGNRLYAANDEGQVSVIALDEKGKVLAKIDFGERFQATPASDGDAIYFRSDKHLWKVAPSGDGAG